MNVFNTVLNLLIDIDLKRYWCVVIEEEKLFEELKVGINIAALESLSVNWSQN